MSNQQKIDPVLVGRCLAKAGYKETELRQIAFDLGFTNCEFAWLGASWEQQWYSQLSTVQEKRDHCGRFHDAYIPRTIGAHAVILGCSERSAKKDLQRRIAEGTASTVKIGRHISYIVKKVPLRLPSEPKLKSR